MTVGMRNNLMALAHADSQQLAQEAPSVCTPDVDGAQSNWICERVYEWTGLPWLASAGGTILKILFIVALAWFATRLVRRSLRRLTTRITEQGVESATLVKVMSPLSDTSAINLQRTLARAHTITGVLRSLAVFVIWLIAIIMILGTFVPVGPLIASAGILGVALGFGAQQLVQDFLSGIFMLLEDQYGVGDVINVGEAEGLVESVSLRTTRMRAVDGTVWYVPNGEIRRVGNMSHQWSRALLDVPVAYDTDIEMAQQVIKRTADGLWQDPEWASLVLSEPEVWGVQDWGQSEVVIRLVVQTVPLEQWAVARELRKRLKHAFDDAGIEIPFPQRTIWVRGAQEEDPVI
jgi:small-conductance mechanosensitive channel